MKLLRSIKAEHITIVVLSLFSLLSGLFPTLYRYYVTPKGQIFAGTEFYSDDYSIYVSNIRQGTTNRWTLLDKHTSEPHTGTIIHDEYLILGKIAKIFSIGPVIMYHLSRFVLGGIFLFLAYLFTKTLFPTNSLSRQLTFTLLTLASSFPILNSSSPSWHLSWLSELDIINRTTVLPHYLLGYIFFLAASILLFKALSSLKSQQATKYLILSIIAGNLIGFVHPVSLVTLDFTLILFSIISIAKDKARAKQFISTTALFILLTSPFLLYFKSQFKVSPWNHMEQWENVTGNYTQIAPLKEYALSIGPIFFLGLFALPHFLKTNKPAHIFTISWIIATLILIYFSYPILHISQIRFMQTPIFLPIACLAALGIFQTTKLTSKLIPPSISLAALLLMVILSGVPTYLISLQTKLKSYSDFSTLIYPTKYQLEAIQWLGNYSNSTGSVIAAYEASSLIPFLGGNSIYAGHIWATLNLSEKSKNIGLFFSNALSIETAKKFLTENHIEYVFYGYQEKSYSGDKFSYPFLTLIHENPEAKIYKVETNNSL